MVRYYEFEYDWHIYIHIGFPSRIRLIIPYMQNPSSDCGLKKKNAKIFGGIIWEQKRLAARQRILILLSFLFGGGHKRKKVARIVNNWSHDWMWEWVN